MIKKSNHKYLIVTLFLVIAVDTAGIGFVWSLFGPLFVGKDTTLFTSATSIEWRNILYGVTIGITNLAAFLSAPIIGIISDNIGRRKVLIFCLIGTVIGMVISILGITFNQVFLLIFSRAVVGMFAASQVLAHAMIIDISTTENKSARLGIISAASNMGYIFGPIVGSLLVNKALISWFDLTTPFYFVAILTFLCTLLLLKTFKEKSKKTSTTSQAQFTKKFLIFTKAFTDKSLRIYAIMYFFLQMGWVLYLQTSFLSLVQEHNYSSKDLGYFSAWLGAILSFGLLVIVRILTRYISLKQIISTTFAIAFICCFIAALYYKAEISIWFNLLPMACAISLGSNAILTTISNIAQKHEQGWMMGISTSISALAWAITPPIAGLMLTFGFSLPLFIASAIFFLCAIIFNDRVKSY